MNHGCSKLRQGTLLALELLAQRPQGKVPCAVLDKVGPPSHESPIVIFRQPIAAIAPSSKSFGDLPSGNLT
jgi:hypothetical protein